MSATDPTFYERADAHIQLSNAQLAASSGPAVAASMAWATTRFNAWLCANMYKTKDEMARHRDEAIAALSEHYTQQLRENFDDYIENFDTYLNPVVAAR